MNSKNWNDRADKDLFFTILSVKNIGVISGSEWTTIGNHMRSLGYGFTNEGCRQHFQGLRRAQHKAETTGPNGDTVRRNDPTMNPITRRPGPGRGRPRKQPPVPVPGAPGEGAPHPPLAPGIIPGPPPNSAPPYPQGASAQPYGPVPAGHQPIHPQPVQAAIRPGSISSAPPTPQAPTPGNAVPGPVSVTYPSPTLAPALPQDSPHLHPLQYGQPSQSAQSGQQPQPGQQSQSDQHSQSGQQPPPQSTQAQPAQQSEPDQQPHSTTPPQPGQEIQPDYQSQEPPQEPPRETREATDASAASQPQPIEQNHEPHSLMSQEQLQPEHEDLDADVDADGEADVDDEPSAKRQRMGSPEPPKGDDMDDEAVLALAAHNGSTDFASDFATYDRQTTIGIVGTVGLAQLAYLLSVITFLDFFNTTSSTIILPLTQYHQLNIMPGKPSDWDNADFLLDLVVGLYTGAQTNKGLTPAIKESIEEYLKTRGYTTSFDAVRIMAKRQVMVWDANVHEDILISLFQHIKPSSEDWSNVMSDLQEKGYSFTEGALRFPSLASPIQVIMPPKPARGWDATSHEDLLLALLEEMKPNKAILTSVADKMRDKGYSYSYDAINQHVQKLRKNRDTTAIQNSGSETATPRKPRVTASKTPKRTPKRKAPAKSASIAGDEEDLEDMKLQLKMEETDGGDDAFLSPKGAKRARTVTPKAEAEADDEPDSGEV
ncbi:hypothetical protein FLAG1_00271 [Fusarium langsethiae]|uniref:Uncharacterized protein n=1 Tax=Fusarium langsethiae TaxID=179993 RepID=A0A0N0DIA7_FUSLA|nr:hypothetical protein FLAG1_00271 [Fusarium langsethiae]